MTEALDQSGKYGSKVVVMYLRIRIFIQEICYANHYFKYHGKKAKTQAADNYLSNRCGSDTVYMKLRGFPGLILKASWSSVAVGKLFLERAG